MPVSLHAITGMERIPWEYGAEQRAMRPTVTPHEIEKSFSTLILSGVLERFPRLKLVSAENNCGWLPYYLQRVDRAFTRFGPSGTATPWPTKLTLKPSEYFQRQMYCTFIDDPFGVASRHWIGVDNVMWSSDYPTPPPPGRVLAPSSNATSKTSTRKSVGRSSERMPPSSTVLIWANRKSGAQLWRHSGYQRCRAMLASLAPHPCGAVSCQKPTALPERQPCKGEVPRFATDKEIQEKVGQAVKLVVTAYTLECDEHVQAMTGERGFWSGVAPLRLRVEATSCRICRRMAPVTWPQSSELCVIRQ